MNFGLNIVRPSLKRKWTHLNMKISLDKGLSKGTSRKERFSKIDKITRVSRQ